MEANPTRLRKLADRARRLADGARSEATRQKNLLAAAEFEQRAKEIEIDNATGQ